MWNIMNNDRLAIQSRNAEADALPRLLEHSVRLLYPFWIEPNHLDKAVIALSLLHHAGQQREFKTWREADRVPGLYREGTLPLVAQVLFGIRNGTHRYLRVDRDALEHWFPQGGCFGPEADGKTRSYSLAPVGEGIELFLSPHGVGLLSMTFGCLEPGSLEALPTLHCHLSQCGGDAAWRYQTPSSADAAPTDAPFAQRLGTGAFTFKELVAFLLAPLKSLGLQEVQPQFSLYSLSRLDAEAAFANTDKQSRLGAILAALAHIEEAASQVGVSERLLSPQHWAAAGSLGAAHLLCGRQGMTPGLYPFFVPHLCATLQRLTLQRLLWEADWAILETEDSLRARQDKLRALRQEMLRFSVQGCFTEISSREAHNQYYDLVLEGLRVPTSLRLLQRVLDELESAATAEFQQKATVDADRLAFGLADNRDAVGELQTKLEWLQVLFASFYATTLVYFAGNGFFSTAYAHWGVVGTSFISGLLSLACIKPGLNVGKSHKSFWLLLGTMSLLFLVWMAVGWQQYPAANPGGEGNSFLCTDAPNCVPKKSEGTI
jgi:hypothetical protein